MRLVSFSPMSVCARQRIRQAEITLRQVFSIHCRTFLAGDLSLLSGAAIVLLESPSLALIRQVGVGLCRQLEQNGFTPSVIFVEKRFVCHAFAPELAARPRPLLFSIFCFVPRGANDWAAFSLGVLAGSGERPV